MLLVAVLLVVLLVSCIFSVFSEGTYPWWMLLVAVLLVVLLVSCLCSRRFRGYLSLVDVTGGRSLGCVACVLYIFCLFRGYLSLVDVTGSRSLGCVACVLYIFCLFRGYLSLVDVIGGRSLGCTLLTGTYTRHKQHNQENGYQ